MVSSPDVSSALVGSAGALAGADTFMELWLP
jgi:hypothetical protein